MDMDAQITHSTHLLLRQAASLLLYQPVLSDPVGQAFLQLLQTLRHSNGDDIAVMQSYGHWFQVLAARRRSWPDHLLKQILQVDNPFTQQAQRVEPRAMAPALAAAARHDLQILQQLYRCSSQQLSQWVQTAAALDSPPVVWDESQGAQPQADRQSIRQLPLWVRLEGLDDWGEALDDLAAYHRQVGAGPFAEYRAFRWQGGQLNGIAHPDPVRLQDLAGYEHQRAALLKNTEALLAGYPALHVLLYGSRGSGKSSLVKSLLHSYGDRGLRLIEVVKSELNNLPAIVDRLRHLPQAFIIFVDDLSFEEDDDAYKALKVVLEGNLTARPQNVVVYATSNRRHLIREFFGDRPRPSDADEIHSWDTVQEKLSFSDRFGLTLTFEPADQPTYLQIVRHLANQADLDLAPDDLEFRALQWATRHNGRSGRSARQFIDALRAELAIAPNLAHKLAP